MLKEAFVIDLRFYPTISLEGRMKTTETHSNLPYVHFYSELINYTFLKKTYVSTE